MRFSKRPFATLCLSLGWVAVCLGPGALGQTHFKRGDADGSGCVNCEDAEFILQHLLAEREAPTCLDALDANDDGKVDTADATFVFDFAAGAGVVLPAPGSDSCGPDPDDAVDGLPCAYYPAALCDPAIPACDAPVAVIDGPGVLVLTGTPLRVDFDGRSSTGTGKSPAARYSWSADRGAAVPRPHDGLTTVVFPGAGVYVVRLDVSRHATGSADPADDRRCGYAEKTVVVRDVGGLPPMAPVLQPLDASRLVAPAGRLFRRQVILTEGTPPSFTISSVAPGPPLPPGLAIDHETGVLTWEPGIADLGTHHVIVEAVNAAGAGQLALDLRAVDPAHPAVLYRPPAGAGGGLQLGSAPQFFPDVSPIAPALDLQLGAAGAPCAAQLVTDDGRPPAVRFAPSCDPNYPGLAGRVYSSSSGGAKANAPVLDRFTIEAWLSNVPDAQQASPGAPAFIFSSSSESNAGIALNWVLGTEGGKRYVALVSTSTGTQTFALDAADFTGTAPRQIVLAYDGAAASFFLDGAPAGTAASSGDLGSWDIDLALHAGNSELRSRPFTGDVHLTAFYPDALSPEAIAVLFQLGPDEADPNEVPPPIAEICPDPREIGRVDIDGAQSRSGLGGGNGGGAAEPPACGLLREHVWILTAPPGAILGEETIPPADPCQRVLKVTYDAGQSFELEACLVVNQIPIRGHERQATMTKRIVLPPAAAFDRGDANADRQFDISDPVWSLSFLFSGGDPPPCRDAADANDDGLYDISDAVYSLGYNFLGGPPPPAPFGECGPDPTTAAPDTLDCAAFPPCTG